MSSLESQILSRWSKKRLRRRLRGEHKYELLCVLATQLGVTFDMAEAAVWSAATRRPYSVVFRKFIDLPQHSIVAVFNKSVIGFAYYEIGGFAVNVNVKHILKNSVLATPEEYVQVLRILGKCGYDVKPVTRIYQY